VTLAKAFKQRQEATEGESVRTVVEQGNHSGTRNLTCAGMKAETPAGSIENSFHRDQRFSTHEAT